MRRVPCSAGFALAFALAGAFAAREARADDPPAECTAKTTCAGHAGYYASKGDVDRLTAVADPILRDVRRCLDGVGARHVAASLVMRWNSEGTPVEVKIDTPGYESLPCVAKAASKLAVLQNPHETSIRCELGCPKPPPPPTPPPPVVGAAPAGGGSATTAPPSDESATTAPPAPAPARAAAAPPVPSERTQKVWYGWQTLIADSASAVVGFGGAAANAPGATVTGIVGFVLATPIVHMAHGNVGQGFGSLGIRILMPPIAMGIGAIAGVIADGAAGRGQINDGPSTGVAVGGLLGAAGCVAIDAAALAYTKEPVDDGTAITKRREAPHVSFAPTLDVRSDRATVGVAGLF